MFNDILTTERLSEDWWKSTFISIFKNKGDVQNCSNYRGIKLRSHSVKLWERVIDNRIRREAVINDEQFGFMPKGSTTDAIFALQMTAEKHWNRQYKLHCVFIDLKKGI